MMRFLAIILLSVIPSFGLAQSIRVQSGEHEDFSRIAFNLPEAVTWEIQKTDVGVDVVFSSGDVSTNGLFDFIPRTRLENAKANGSIVSLEFNCRCETSSFVFQDSFLILDILDPTENDVPTALVQAVSEPNIDYQEFEDWSISPVEATPTPTQDPVESVQERAPSSFSMAFSQSTLARDPVIDPKEFVSNLGLPTPIAEEQPELSDLGALDVQIGEAFAQALSEGFLDAALPRATPNEDAEPTGSVANASPSSSSADFSEGTMQQNVPENILDAIRITKPNANLSEALVGLQSNQNFDGVACIPGEYFSGFSSLEADFWDQKASLSGELYNDIDKLDIEAGTELAKLLIGHGFGAEGEAILRLIQPESPDQVLVDLSRLMDGAPVLQNEVWKQQISCAGVSALFGILATEDFSSGMQYSKESILMSFQRFSLPVRLYLGPRLAQRFVKSGDLRFAEAFNESLVRASQETPSAARLSEALLQRATGNIEAAEESLVSLIGERGQVGPAAILELVDMRLEENLVFNEDEARLISSIAFAQRQSSDAKELQRASVQALTRAGLYFDALDETDRLETSFDLDEWFSKDITEFASATEFLSIAFDSVNREIKVDAYPGFLDRLNALGFGDSSDTQMDVVLSTIAPLVDFPPAVQIDDEVGPATVLAGATEILQQTTELRDFVTSTFEN